MQSLFIFLDFGYKRAVYARINRIYCSVLKTAKKALKPALKQSKARAPAAQPQPTARQHSRLHRIFSAKKLFLSTKTRAPAESSPCNAAIGWSVFTMTFFFVKFEVCRGGDFLLRNVEDVEGRLVI